MGDRDELMGDSDELMGDSDELMGDRDDPTCDRNEPTCDRDNPACDRDELMGDRDEPTCERNEPTCDRDEPPVTGTIPCDRDDPQRIPCTHTGGGTAGSEGVPACSRIQTSSGGSTVPFQASADACFASPFCSWNGNTASSGLSRHHFSASTECQRSWQLPLPPGEALQLLLLHTTLQPAGAELLAADLGKQLLVLPVLSPALFCHLWLRAKVVSHFPRCCPISPAWEESQPHQRGGTESSEQVPAPPRASAALPCPRSALEQELGITRNRNIGSPGAGTLDHLEQELGITWNRNIGSPRAGAWDHLEQEHWITRSRSLGSPAPPDGPQDLLPAGSAPATALEGTGVLGHPTPCAPQSGAAEPTALSAGSGGEERRISASPACCQL
ncbi:uncharacterized protein LOC117007047 [Catharus ustulatus]|uniref:uncharacterized protein LOC117007047 n=1 Tax=Catharus ustulatus TaxID=91951 RepID=UPI00140A1141|nr:uncharacterized protein LOC117007047 [Catharus ustulatus]